MISLFYMPVKRRARRLYSEVPAFHDPRKWYDELLALGLIRPPTPVPGSSSVRYYSKDYGSSFSSFGPDLVLVPLQPISLSSGELLDRISFSTYAAPVGAAGLPAIPTRLHLQDASSRSEEFESFVSPTLADTSGSVQRLDLTWQLLWDNPGSGLVDFPCLGIMFSCSCEDPSGSGFFMYNSDQYASFGEGFYPTQFSITCPSYCPVFEGFSSGSCTGDVCYSLLG
jgi:hypothetical protein